MLNNITPALCIQHSEVAINTEELLFMVDQSQETLFGGVTASAGSEVSLKDLVELNECDISIKEEFTITIRSFTLTTAPQPRSELFTLDTVLEDVIQTLNMIQFRMKIVSVGLRSGGWRTVTR